MQKKQENSHAKMIWYIKKEKIKILKSTESDKESFYDAFKELTNDLKKYTMNLNKIDIAQFSKRILTNKLKLSLVRSS